MPATKNKSKQTKPAVTIVVSFLLVILVGSVLLMLPFSSANGQFTNPLTALFTATSATCVTGLIIEDTGTYWSAFGQTVILLMIQIGGLGLVTLTSFFNFAIHKKLDLRSVQVASESVNTSGFYGVKQLVRSVIKIAFLCEAAGALLLMICFVPRYGLMGVYVSVYLAITAFCNAGFDVLGMLETPFCSLTPLSEEPVVMLVIPLLIIAGGLGFVVWSDVIGYRKSKRLQLQTEIVLISTAVLILLGTLLTMLLEWSNTETIGNMSFGGKLVNSFFQSVTLRTAGFNTIDQAALTPITKLLGIILMFIGVAPGSTGGGIKITTFVIIVMTVSSVINNKPDTIIMKRKIEKDAVYKSLSIIVLAMLVTAVTAIILTFSIPECSGIDATFEAVSAMSTTGLSNGVTSLSGPAARILLCLTMFIGRVSPVSFAISMSSNRSAMSKNSVYPEGKLMVG